MKILAIETSCDDTAAAILADGKILSNVVSSQTQLHAKYGGIFPSLAKREHQKNLVPVLKQALEEAGLLNEKIKMKSEKRPASPAKRGEQSKIKKLNDILNREELLLKQTNKFLTKYSMPKVDAIAVTVGPGLEPCLWVGVNFAKALAFWWNIPVIPVNHIESHILANFIDSNEKIKMKSEKRPASPAKRGEQSKIKKLFPAVCLVVSGGHTQIVLIEKLGQYKILGETRDDAAGECFDKTARLLGLPYPGGPAVAAEAAKFKVQSSLLVGGQAKFKVTLPRPMLHSKDYDFSFSGLKTAVLYQIKKDGRKAKNKTYIQQMCCEVQQSIIDVLIAKTIKAAKDYRVKTIMLGGGVSANEALRGQFKVQSEKLKVNLYIPPKNLCTDNAAMVAMAGYLHWPKGKKTWQEINAEANLKIA